jgi:uncharacterized membrane protein YobD (UPF0266 family)
MGVFAFFAVFVIIFSGVNLARTTTGAQINTITEKRAYETAYCLLGIFYLGIYICYINILQGFWSFKHQIIF